MQSNIQVKFLTKKEFKEMRNEDARYEHVDETNLGFSDKEKNRVYVRAGLDLELTKYLINHEIEHLYELEGTHEDEHGIRHKKGNFFKDILGPFSFNPGNIFGGAKGPAADISQALLPALGSLINPALGVGLGAAEGAKGLFGQQNQQQNQGGLNGLFQQQGQQPSYAQNVASLGQGFGQTGSFTPGSQGAGGSSTMGLQQPGLGQAGIQFGQGAFGNQDQSQSGYFRPNYKF